MISSLTSLLMFKIETTFNEWIAIFDCQEENKRHSRFNIKSLFKGVSKEGPQKVFFIHKTPEGNIQNFFNSIEHWISTHKVYLSIMK